MSAIKLPEPGPDVASPDGAQQSHDLGWSQSISQGASVGSFSVYEFDERAGAGGRGPGAGYGPLGGDGDYPAYDEYMADFSSKIETRKRRRSRGKKAASAGRLFP